MIIKITGQAGEPSFPFETSGPWKLFREEIVRSGHVIWSENTKEPADALIANSIDRKLVKFIEKSSIPLDRRALVIWEPHIVDRSLYNPKILELFGGIFAPSKLWAEKLNCSAFLWPQDSQVQYQKFDKWIERSNTGVLIQGNKFSATKGEMYSIRRKVLRTIDPSFLKFYGTDWNKGVWYDSLKWTKALLRTSYRDFSLDSITGIGKSYANYCGEVADKNPILERFRISIVIENSLDFVSEKLFDSIKAGCISIYVGPQLEAFDIPSSCAIQVRPDPEVIVRAFYEVSKLPSEIQKQIAISQNENLSKVAPNWNNKRILSELALSILQSFN